MTEAVGGINERVRALIDERDGGNMSAAARRCGVSQSTMQRLYSATIDSPSTATLRKVAAGYNVDLDWLLSGDESVTRSGSGTSRARPGYGDGPADQLIRELDLPEERLPLPDRIKEAYLRAVDGRFDAFQFAIVDSWRDRKISRPDVEW